MFAARIADEGRDRGARFRRRLTRLVKVAAGERSPHDSPRGAVAELERRVAARGADQDLGGRRRAASNRRVGATAGDRERNAVGPGVEASDRGRIRQAAGGAGDAFTEGVAAPERVDVVDAVAGDELIPAG